MNVINIEASNPYLLGVVTIKFLIRYEINYLSIENDNGFEIHFDQYILRIIHNEVVINNNKDDLSQLLNNIIKKTEEFNITSSIDITPKKSYIKNNTKNNNQLQLTKQKNRKLNNYNNKRIYRRR